MRHLLDGYRAALLVVGLSSSLCSACLGPAEEYESAVAHLGDADDDGATTLQMIEVSSMTTAPTQGEDGEIYYEEVRTFRDVGGNVELTVKMFLAEADTGDPGDAYLRNYLVQGWAQRLQPGIKVRKLRLWAEAFGSFEEGGPYCGEAGCAQLWQLPGRRFQDGIVYEGAPPWADAYLNLQNEMNRFQDTVAMIAVIDHTRYRFVDSLIKQLPH